MYKAVPVIAVSAAGLTWLLHAPGVIDTTATKSPNDQSPTDSPPPTRTTPVPSPYPPATTTPTRRRGDDDDPPAPTRSSATTTTAPPTTSTPSKSGGGGGPRTADGPIIDTRYGPVQVEVVVSGGKITDVKAL